MYRTTLRRINRPISSYSKKKIELKSKSPDQPCDQPKILTSPGIAALINSAKVSGQGNSRNCSHQRLTTNDT